MLNVRQDVNKAMEIKRTSGELKGSLDANVVLYAADELKSRLEMLGDELRFVLITSDATVANLTDASADAFTGEISDTRVTVVASTEAKCERCWHRRDDVGKHTAHPTLCGRCITNIDSEGETRHYA